MSKCMGLSRVICVQKEKNAYEYAHGEYENQIMMMMMMMMMIMIIIIKHPMNIRDSLTSDSC